MKKFTYTLITFCLLAVLFSCEKEEKASIGGNKITIGTTTSSTILYTTATVSSAVEYIKGNKVIEHGHCWGTVSNPVVEGNKTSLGSLGDVKTITSQIDKLSANTTYHVRPYITTKYETIYGSETTIKTMDYAKPTVATTVVSGTTPFLATSGGNVTSDGGLPVTARGVVWNTTSEPTTTNKTGITIDGTGTGSFNSQLTNLQPGTTYYLRAYATSAKDTGYGEQIIFTTKSITVPEVTTANITGIFTTSAVCGGYVTNDGYQTVTARGVVWSTISNPTIANKIGVTADGNGIGSFTSQLNSLQPGTTYYLRAYATSAKDTGYGEQVIFTTKSITSPEVTTTNVTGISTSSAVCGGNVTNDGYQAVTARGVVWSTTVNPTITSKIGITADGNGTGSFVSQLINLQPGTIYYLRSYATNSVGTSYGNELSFTTKVAPTLASLTTSIPTDITDKSATLGGSILNDGNTTIIERGVCYSLSQNPTITNSKVTSTVGSGSFSVSVTGLSATTTYYLRAYATNSQGTAYGNEVSFKTMETLVTDIDGNVYHSVTIGTQVWMVENLKTTKYSDGASINIVTGSGGDVSTEACCWYDDLENNKALYGALYNWDALNSGKLAPKGWHIPTKEEWNTLINYIGGESFAGGALKEASTIHWISPNIGATNSYGFSALPGGTKSLPTTRPAIHYSSGYEFVYSKMGESGLWWSCTSIDSNSAYLFNLQYNSTTISTIAGKKGLYFSVRCIKD